MDVLDRLFLCQRISRQIGWKEKGRRRRESQVAVSWDFFVFFLHWDIIT